MDKYITSYFPQEIYADKNIIHPKPLRKNDALNLIKEKLAEKNFFPILDSPTWPVPVGSFLFFKICQSFFINEHNLSEVLEYGDIDLLFPDNNDLIKKPHLLPIGAKSLEINNKIAEITDVHYFSYKKQHSTNPLYDLNSSQFVYANISAFLKKYSNYYSYTGKIDSADFYNFLKKDFYIYQTLPYIYENKQHLNILMLLIQIKRSHLGRNINWQKHITKYHQMKKFLNHRFIFFFEETFDESDFYKLRKAETKLFEYDFPLNKSKDEFFTDNVNYIYDHDSLHDACAIDDKPAYAYFLKEGEEVSFDVKKLLSLRDTPRALNTAKEETAVIALERFILPRTNKIIPPKVAYDLAVQKLCTSLTQGKYQDFCIENYPNIITHKTEYMSIFAANLDKLKPFKRG